MAFDTKYRPQTYDDVLGQSEYKEVLREIVRSGTGLHQSYLFCGQHGSGKTTLGRILARALLCLNPQEGNPCDECISCLAVLEGRSECFIEFDAATNSGKDDIKKLVEQQHVSTFSGQDRIYLFDESHQLSKQALDALLKPMEDEQPGSENKQLVCIFCTTEPERMRSTIFSRCAPAFTIRPCTPESIAGRLAYVCQQEGIEYEESALLLLAEFYESHIRDALKSMEGISKLGTVNIENANRYLRMDAAQSCAQVLAMLGTDLQGALNLAESLHEFISPSVAYKRLSEIAMLAYRTKLGVGRIPGYWDKTVLENIAAQQGDYLLTIAGHLSERPAHPSQAMLLCDLAHLHHGKLGTTPTMRAPQINAPAQISAPAQSANSPKVGQAPVPAAQPNDLQPSTPETARSAQPIDPTPVNVSPSLGKVQAQSDPVIQTPVPPVGRGRDGEHGDGAKQPSGVPANQSKQPNLDFFRTVLRTRVAELEAARRGSKGRNHLGSS